MIIVCLDLCAISRLALHNDDSAREIRHELLERAASGRLLCPIARETVLETASCDKSERLAIYELHCALAGDSSGQQVWFFKNVWQMENEETLAMAQSLPYPYPVEISSWGEVEDDVLAAKVSQEIREIKKRMRLRVEGHPLVEVDGRQPLQFFQEEVLFEHVAHVWRQVGRLIEDREPDTRDHMGYEVALYLRRAGVTKEQLTRLRIALENHEWEEIPVIRYRTILCGQLELEYRLPAQSTPRQYQVNDEFDIARLAVGLRAADILITDRKMAQLCVNAKIHKHSQTRVFGMQQLPEALDFLRTSS